MNRYQLPLVSFLLIFIATTMSSCEAIASIFKAGVWSGIIIVVLVVALILYLVGRGKK
jgi:cytosine/uracil/thiamine/allantoin permease